jgi:hypothetical protein
MVAQPRQGRAWRGCPKPRRRGWLRSNRRMPSCDAEPVSVSGAPGGYCRAVGPLLWWNSRAEALGIKSARIAGPILPGVSKWFSSLAAESFPQRRTGPIKEALHPRTLSAGIVILADGLSRRRWRRGRSCPTLCDIQVAPLVARMQLSVEPQFHPQWLVPHTGLGMAARNLIPLPVKGKRVVVGNNTLFDVTQDRGQILSLVCDLSGPIHT